MRIVPLTRLVWQEEAQIEVYDELLLEGSNQDLCRKSCFSDAVIKDYDKLPFGGSDEASPFLFCCLKR